jgi:hypothetical protein
VEFNKLGGGLGRGFNLAVVSVYEQTDRNAIKLKGLDDLGDRIKLPHYIQSTFGGNFFPAFGDEGDVVGSDVEGDRDHFFGGGHFEVEVGANGLAEQADIAILNMAAVFPQVDGDAISASEFG